MTKLVPLTSLFFGFFRLLNLWPIPMTDQTITTIQVALRWVHIMMGAVALLVGLVPLVVGKGGRLHIRAGQLFYLSIAVASFSGIVLGLWNGNLLLFFVGVLALWSVALGRFALAQSGLIGQSRILHLSCTIGFILVALGTAAYSLMVLHQINIVLLVFLIVGLFSTLPEWRFLYGNAKGPEVRIGRHVGHTMGATIASWTAFLVVSNVFWVPILNWYVPTIVGSVLIAYWQRRIRTGTWKQVHFYQPRSK